MRMSQAFCFFLAFAARSDLVHKHTHSTQRPGHFFLAGPFEAGCSHWWAGGVRKGSAAGLCSGCGVRGVGGGVPVFFFREKLWCASAKTPPLFF